MQDSVIHPIGSNVLLECCRDAEERTQGGIVMPATSKGRQRFAVVLSVGPKADLDIVAGDVVVFDPYRVRAVLSNGQLANAAGTPIASGGDRFLIDAEHVQAVAREAPIAAAELRYALTALRRAVTERYSDYPGTVADLIEAIERLEGDLLPREADEEDCSCG